MRASSGSHRAVIDAEEIGLIRPMLLNDLDIDTLELLEDLLQNYDGTVFLVSHDRAFMDNVVTSTIALEGDGLWREYEGGVTDWLTQKRRSGLQSPNNMREQLLKQEQKQETKAVSTVPVPVVPAAAPAVKTRKLSYKEQRELETLPEKITALETEQASITSALADGTLFATDSARALQLTQRNTEIDDELLAALERWEVLGG